jgi:plasmid stability protein
MAQTSDRIKVTLTLPAELVRAYRIRAARKGLHDNAVVEEALRAHLGIGLLEELPKLAGLGDLTDAEASKIALEALKGARADRKREQVSDASRRKAIQRIVTKPTAGKR